MIRISALAVAVALACPMLVINGMRDTQVPVEDLFLLMRSGSPKEVWINP